MVCPHDGVEWVGPDLPCWFCEKPGLPKFPKKEKT